MVPEISWRGALGEVGSPAGVGRRNALFTPIFDM